VHGVGDEEDPLDGVVGEGLAGCGVNGLHCWEMGCQIEAMECCTETVRILGWEGQMRGVRRDDIETLAALWDLQSLRSVCEHAPNIFQGPSREAYRYSRMRKLPVFANFSRIMHLWWGTHQKLMRIDKTHLNIAFPPPPPS
jgi:hypothetical protein